MPSKKSRRISPANRKQTRRTNPPKHILAEEGGLPTTVVFLGTPVVSFTEQVKPVSVEDSGFPVGSAFRLGKESFRSKKTSGWLDACTIM